MGVGVQWEPLGARITLPPGQSAGVAPSFTVQGDFEITTSYEILKSATPATGYGVGVSLYAAIDPDTNDAVSLARRTMPDGRTLFVSNRMTPAPGRPRPGSTASPRWSSMNSVMASASPTASASIRESVAMATMAVR